jgi:hypothetical protein
MKKVRTENIGDPSGEASFRGGPYGFGGKQQLIVQNPATYDLETAEEEEKDENYEQEKWGLGKHQQSRTPPFFNPKVQTTMPDAVREAVRTLVEREVSDMLYRDLPGWPRMNTLVQKQEFVPTPDDPAELDPQSGAPIEKLGPTVFGKEQQLQNEEMNVWSSTNPGVRGYNNLQINSLARPAVFVDPNQKLDSNDPVNPVGGMGAVGWPRKYVPDDYEARMNQYDDQTMGDQETPAQVDPLGTRRLQMSQVTEKRNKGALRNKINPLTLTALMEENDDEEAEDSTFFDTMIKRVRLALQYEEPTDVIKRLISDGIPQEKAFLLVAAARILNKNEQNLTEIALSDVGDVCYTDGSTHILKTCKIGSDRFYLKFSEESLFDNQQDPNLQIGVEYLAYRIYGLYPGVKVPKTIHVVSDPKKRKIGLATSEVAGDTGSSVGLRKWGQLMSAGVLVDVFLANWDVVNPGNAIVSDDGKDVTRIDPGGSLSFRAQGGRKGDRFNPETSELDTMLDTDRQDTSGAIFKSSDMTMAAKTFLSVPWTRIQSAIGQAANEVLAEMKKAGINPAPWKTEVKNIATTLAKRHKAVMKHCVFVLDKASTIKEDSDMVYPRSNDKKNDMTGDLNADGKGPDGAAEAFEKSRDEILDDPRLVKEGPEKLPFSDEEMVGKRLVDRHIRAGQKGTIIKVIHGKPKDSSLPGSIWLKIKWDDGAVGPSRWRDVSLLPDEPESIVESSEQKRNKKKRQEIVYFIESRRKMLLQQKNLVKDGNRK